METVVIQCPYCWQSFEVLVDPSISHQNYVEDCEVCCQPIQLAVEVEEGAPPSVEARRENE